MIDKNEILIRVFQRICDERKDFEAICSENILSHPSYFAMNIIDLAHDLARDIKIRNKSSKPVNIEFQFPRNTNRICHRIHVIEFYEPVSDGATRVFWDRFGKAMQKD